MARGMFFSGSSLSPAAIPINSEPWYEKITFIMVVKRMTNPVGNKPDGAKFFANGAGRSDNGMMPKIAPSPIIIKKITAITLIPANQYSASAKPFVVKAFSKNNKAIKIAHQIQTDISGNHRFIKIPAAVNSTPAVVAEPIKYIHPSEKPAEGLINLVA